MFLRLKALYSYTDNITYASSISALEWSSLQFEVNLVEHFTFYKPLHVAS